ncbi:MAG: ATP-binding protein [bacterium]
MIKRSLDLRKYSRSFFLFGPRQVGKTYLIEHTLSPDIFINLLDQREYLRYAKDVSLLSKEVGALNKTTSQIVIDEIQRCPDLLNEVQLLMGKLPGAQFILTGSSARKLKRAGVNLLGGRAITLNLHPLTHEETGNLFSLEKALRFGGIPSVVLQQNEAEKIRSLKSYSEVYLKEEIQQEALTRNIPAFARFLELAAFENGNVINYQGIAREIGIHSKTVKEYFQILEDTLLGFLFSPYSGSHRKRIITHPRFYFFDRGVVTALRGELSQDLTAGTSPYGRAFEHFIVLELKRLLDYREKEARLSFFRTSDGAEVDIILELDKEVWAVEIKSSAEPAAAEIRGLKSFKKDHRVDRSICVCQTPRPFTSEGIEFLNWQAFLKQF